MVSDKFIKKALLQHEIRRLENAVSRSWFERVYGKTFDEYRKDIIKPKIIYSNRDMEYVKKINWSKIK